jgi:peptidoglycan/LPS O-acetylase OafA/YrhL
VIFFFVLSGFLITTLLLREEERHAVVSLRGFWMRRAVRLLPAFYVYLAMQTLLIHRFPQDFVAAAFYISNYYQAVRPWVTTLAGHTWSLSVEEQFYLLWPVAFVLVRNRKRLKAGLIGGIALVQIARAIGNHFGVTSSYRYFAFEFRCDALLIGCLMALALKETPDVPRWMLNKWLGVCLLAIFPALMYPVKNHFLSAIVVSDLGYTIGAYASALLIIQAIAHTPGFLTNRLMEYLGSISYPIYLYHLLLLELAKQLHTHWGMPLVGFVYLMGTLATASLSRFLVEEPCLRLRARMDASRKRRNEGRSVETNPVPVSEPTLIRS